MAGNQLTAEHLRSLKEKAQNELREVNAENLTITNVLQNELPAQAEQVRNQATEKIGFLEGRKQAIHELATGDGGLSRKEADQRVRDSGLIDQIREVTEQRDAELKQLQKQYDEVVEKLNTDIRPRVRLLVGKIQQYSEMLAEVESPAGVADETPAAEDEVVIATADEAPNHEGLDPAVPGAEESVQSESPGEIGPVEEAAPGSEDELTEASLAEEMLEEAHPSPEALQEAAEELSGLPSEVEAPETTEGRAGVTWVP